MDLPVEHLAELPSAALEQRLAARLATLRTEFALGERRLMALEEEGRALRDTMLRIAGAIEVLQAELGSPRPSE